MKVAYGTEGPKTIPKTIDGNNVGSVWYAEHPADQHWNPHTENVPNDIIDVKTLLYQDFTKSGTTTHIWFADKERNVYYPMFMTDFMNMVARLDFSAGVIENVKLVGIKRGRNYGMRLVWEGDDDELD